MSTLKGNSSEDRLSENVSSTDELYCVIGSFFLLLPIIICIIKDITYDYQYYSKSSIMKRNRSEIALSCTERKTLLTCAGGDPMTITHQATVGSSPIINAAIISFNPFELLLFNTFTIICYLIIRIIASITNLRRDYKFYAAELQDIYAICLRSTIIFVFGSVYNRKPFLHFLLSCTWFLCLYTLVFELSPEGFQLSAKMTIGGLLIFTVLAILGIACYVVGDNMCYSWSVPKWRRYKFGLFLFIIMYHIGIIMCATDNVEIHLHHHHWSFILCLFVKSPKSSSFAMQALLIGMFIHGICMFGNEEWYQYQWSASAASNFGPETCQKWQCEKFKCEI